MTLRIYLNYDRLTRNVEIDFCIVDDNDYIMHFFHMDSVRPYINLLDARFASALLTLNYANHIRRIVELVYNERADVGGIEVIATEKGNIYPPIKFSNPHNLDWWLTIGGAI